MNQIHEVSDVDLDGEASAELAWRLSSLGNRDGEASGEL
jgi:hypothetical protein